MKTYKVRHIAAVIPALIFWTVSLIFFVMGFSFNDQSGLLLYVGLGLAIANTIFQWIGWDTAPTELSPILYYGWMGSYVLGVGTNMVSLIDILQIPNPILEWTISFALGFMIEVTPERLFVLAWRAINPKPNNQGRPYQGGEDRRGEHRGKKQYGDTPPGMSRADYMRQQAQKNAAAQQKQGGAKQHAAASNQGHQAKPTPKQMRFEDAGRVSASTFVLGEDDDEFGDE